MAYEIIQGVKVRVRSKTASAKTVVFWRHLKEEKTNCHECYCHICGIRLNDKPLWYIQDGRLRYNFSYHALDDCCWECQKFLPHRT